MKHGFIIPVYNHGKTLVPLVKELGRFALPIIIVDDGSDAETKTFIAESAASEALVSLVTLSENLGKGRAVCAGIQKAFTMGLTHALQIDADGQHDVSRAGFFLEQSRRFPRAAICGFPEYDKSVPKVRHKGRVIANTWAKIVTLSPCIRDVLCGFRVYPVENVLRIMERHKLDTRMGFDIDILVRLYWQKTPLKFFPVTVTYPKDGISHFHLVRDNIRISFVFAKLFFGMLPRLPMLAALRSGINS
jgi:glycosyltransferase involved in cell wall biosynthesis